MDGVITPTLVEEVAEALWIESETWKARNSDLVLSAYPYGRLIEVTKNDLRIYARAVLKRLGYKEPE